jgi:hypothetical protein
MSQSTTLILFPQTTYDGGGTANVYSLTGNAVPAAAYYLGNQDLQTVNLKTTDFTGNIVIEATLSANKSTDEYFEVYRLDDCANSNLSMYTNIDGNFVYIRAKIEDFAYGVVNFIKVSY